MYLDFNRVPHHKRTARTEHTFEGHRVEQSHFAHAVHHKLQAAHHCTTHKISEHAVHYKLQAVSARRDVAAKVRKLHFEYSLVGVYKKSCEKSAYLIQGLLVFHSTEATLPPDFTHATPLYTMADSTCEPRKNPDVQVSKPRNTKQVGVNKR